MRAATGGYALSIGGCTRTISSSPVTVRPRQRTLYIGVLRPQHFIRVVPNGIPLEDFEAAQPAKLDLDSQHKVRLVFVGRFDPQKDHRTIMRALPMLSV